MLPGAGGLKLRPEDLVLSLEGAQGDHQALALVAHPLQLLMAPDSFSLEPIGEALRTALDQPGDLKLPADQLMGAAGGGRLGLEALNLSLIGPLLAPRTGHTKAYRLQDDLGLPTHGAP